LPESRDLNNEISGGYVSDLLSDVMGNAAENEVWITLQTHQNVMAIASLKDLAAVILVKGFEPDEDTLERSRMKEFRCWELTWVLSKWPENFLLI
jgi:hypothetical protein